MNSYKVKTILAHKIANYKNELDRVNGLISQSVLKGVTHDQLNKRNMLCFAFRLFKIWPYVLLGIATLVVFQQESVAKFAIGASIHDARQMSRFLDSLIPCPHAELIYAQKFMQTPLLGLLFHDPLPPRVPMLYMEAPLSSHSIKT